MNNQPSLYKQSTTFVLGWNVINKCFCIIVWPIFPISSRIKFAFYRHRPGTTIRSEKWALKAFFSW